MPTQVGNEANQLTSAKATAGQPTIYLGLTLNATQTPYEYDSFDNKYDKNAFDQMPKSMTASVVQNGTTTLTAGAVTVEVPYDAVAKDVDSLTLTVTPRATVGHDSITVTDGVTDFAAYDVELTTLKAAEQITTPITVKMFVGKGRTINGVTGVKV